MTVDTAQPPNTKFPREDDFLGPWPWVTTLIAVVVFCAPGSVFTLAGILGESLAVALGCATWAAIGFSWIWFAWARRRKRAHEAFCQAMDLQPTVDILHALEEESLDVDEAVDILAYLREQRPGWSKGLHEIENTDA